MQAYAPSVSVIGPEKDDKVSTSAIAAKSKRAKPRIDVERRAQIGAEKRARTRRVVLDAAFALLGRERGLMTRIEEILDVADISRGTFYNYFDSMEELFDALQYDLNHDFNTVVLQRINDMPFAAERAGFAIRYYLQRAREDSKWAWAMVHISAGGIIFGAETYRQAQITVEEGIAAGEFELTGPNSGRDILLGTTLAAMVTQLRNPPSDTYPASVARHVLRGMGVPKDRVEEIIHRPLPELGLPSVADAD
ncbi:TetR/AcrR family transcriptional regulator [Sphingobium sp. H39-3-25]|uniref:TetR/AcrR family transcriptional regulator n=1 Tax=Sphingomonadales TaxID=204457 RepID=UPI001C3F476A|nr:TetR/AcrR family transcriptional regulator [Novosphingobium naphthalenivorans]MDF0546639.1 TetR/AcrR family transcriptional regulator [Sphingobium arseniciresistens]